MMDQNLIFTILFVIFIIFIFLNLFCIIFTLATIKFWKNQESIVELAIKHEWNSVFIFSINQQVKKLKNFIIILYSLYFLVIFLTLIILLPSMLDIAKEWVVILYFLSYFIIGFISFGILFGLSNTFWRKKIENDFKSKKIIDLDSYYKEKLDYFYLYYNCKNNELAIKKINFKIPNWLLKNFSKKFNKSLSKIDSEDHEKIYFLIMEYIVRFIGLLHQNDYKDVNYKYIDKKEVLKNIFTNLRKYIN